MCLRRPHRDFSERATTGVRICGRALSCNKNTPCCQIPNHFFFFSMEYFVTFAGCTTANCNSTCDNCRKFVASKYHRLFAGDELLFAPGAMLFPRQHCHTIEKRFPVVYLAGTEFAARAFARGLLSRRHKTRRPTCYSVFRFETRRF